MGVLVELREEALPFGFITNTMTTVTAATCGRSPLLEEHGRMLVANKQNYQKKQKVWRKRVLEQDTRKRDTAFCVALYILSALFSSYPFSSFSFSFFLYFLHLWCAA